MSETVIGIDHGNSYIKTRNTHFVSGFSSYGTAPAMAEDTIAFEGKYYALNEKRVAFQLDKTESEDFFILTLFAVSKEIEKRKIITNFSPESFTEIALAVGLPPEHYGLYKDRFENYFLDRAGKGISYLYNGIPYNFSIKNVYVFPQAFAAYVSTLSKQSKQQEEEEYSNEDRFYVDIGGYTVDTLRIKYPNVDLTYCHSLEGGINIFYNATIDKVFSQSGIRILEDNINDVLLNEKSRLDKDIARIIIDSTQNYVESLLDSLRERGMDFRANPVTFAGGGAIMFQKLISESKKVVKNNVEFLTDSRANALGYEILAKGVQVKEARKKQLEIVSKA